jgi:hypothetical protein
VNGDRGVREVGGRKKSNICRVFVLKNGRDEMMGFKMYVIRGRVGEERGAR